MNFRKVAMLGLVVSSVLSMFPISFASACGIDLAGSVNLKQHEAENLRLQQKFFRTRDFSFASGEGLSLFKDDHDNYVNLTKLKDERGYVIVFSSLTRSSVEILRNTFPNEKFFLDYQYSCGGYIIYATIDKKIAREIGEKFFPNKKNQLSVFLK